jgi:hypothetical protein
MVRWIRKTSLNESLEKRMRFVRLALKLRMILTGQEVRVIAQLNQFRKRAVGGCSGNRKAFLGHAVTVFHVELVTVPVPFHHFATPVDFFSQCAAHNFRWPRAKPHAGAFVANAALFFK